MPVYFGDDEENLLELIDKDRKYISRSAWFKTAAEQYLFGSKDEKVNLITEVPTENHGYDTKALDNFLSSF